MIHSTTYRNRPDYIFIYSLRNTRNQALENQEWVKRFRKDFFYHVVENKAEFFKKLLAPKKQNGGKYYWNILAY